MITQPMIITQSGVVRFKQNKLLYDLLMGQKIKSNERGDQLVYTLNEVAGFRNRFPEIPLKDFRHIWQCLGYSVYGFLDLSWCYSNYQDFEYDSEYGNYIESLVDDAVDETTDVDHPNQPLLEDDTYQPNLVLKKLMELYPHTVSFDQYSRKDVIQYLQMMGASKTEVEKW